MPSPPPQWPPSTPVDWRSEVSRYVDAVRRGDRVRESEYTLSNGYVVRSLIPGFYVVLSQHHGDDGSVVETQVDTVVEEVDDGDCSTHELGGSD